MDQEMIHIDHFSIGPVLTSYTGAGEANPTKRPQNLHTARQ